MAKGILNIQAADGAVIGLHVPDGLTSGERQIALGTNLSGIQPYHLLQGNLAVSNSTTTQGFNTTLYTGNGSTQTITTGIDMNTQWGNTPEEKFGGLVWLKNRNGTAVDHRLVDTVRGATKSLSSNGTYAEYTEATGLTSFNSNGFSIGSLASINTSTQLQVSWNFQTTHRVTGTTNHGMSITNHYNPQTGFGIAVYTGSGLAGHELQTMLGRKVGFVLIKGLASVDIWGTHYNNTSRLSINNTNAETSDSYYVNLNETNVSIMGSAGSHQSWNTSGQQYVMYYWANSYFDKANKLIGNYEIGIYQGTGVSGNKVPTRGKPAWVMIKRIDSTGAWVLADNMRNMFDNSMIANGAEIEVNTNYFNPLSDGISIQGTSADINASGGQYLYIVAYDTNSNGGGTYYPLASDTANVQVNNALIPIAQGIDSNGAKNIILSKNETFSGVTYTQGKNYPYYDALGNSGVSKFAPQYNSYNGFGDYFSTTENKWYNGVSVFSDDCGTTTNFIADEVTGGTAASISSINGELKVVNNGATYGGARFQFNAVNGQKYRVKFTLTSNSTTCTFGIGTSARSVNLGYVSLTNAGEYSLDIVASGSPLYGMAYNNNVAGAISTWDNITIYPINNDGSVKLSNATEITNGRNYLNHIVYADNDGGVLYVEELPKIEYRDIVKANEFKGKNACTAMASINGTTTPPTIYDNVNISSIIKLSTGVYKLYFKERMDNTNYSITTTMYGDQSQTTTASVSLNNVKTLDSVTIYTRVSSGSAYDQLTDSTFDIHIFGGKN